MIQIVAVMPHAKADRLGRGCKARCCNAYTRTMVRICSCDEEVQLITRTLPRGTIWALEAAGA
jgi:hypothetical protein